MAELSSRKLKASTLLEVIVAMVIIMIVFVLATGIFSNVIRSSPSLKAQRIHSISDEIIQNCMISRNWQDEVIQVDSMVFQKKAKPYMGQSDLILLDLRVIEAGITIQKREVVIKGRLNENQ